MMAPAVQLSVPAAIEPVEQPSARAFTAAHQLPYRPRQVLDPAQGAKVISLADARERRGLPRYGVRSPIRHDPIPDGAYTAAGVAWFSREHFLAVVLPLVVAEHPEVLKGQCSPATFLHWARVESAFAHNQHAGRDIIVRPSTVAELMRCAKRTVQRCRAVGRDLHVYVDVFEGRMLTERERLAAQHHHGSPQRGLSNVSCMVVPAEYAGRVLPQPPAPAVGRVTPSRGDTSEVNPPTTLLPVQRTAGSAGTAKGAATPHAPTKTRRRPWSRRPLPGLKLAEDLVKTVRWLSGCPPRRIEGLLRPYATQPDPWTATDLVEEIDQINRRLGYTTPQRPKTTPWGLLRYYLTQIRPDTAQARQRRNRHRPWCGTCTSPDYRWIEIGPDLLPARCPHCGPTARPQTVT